MEFLMGVFGRGRHRRRCRASDLVHCRSARLSARWRVMTDYSSTYTAASAELCK